MEQLSPQTLAICLMIIGTCLAFLDWFIMCSHDYKGSFKHFTWCTICWNVGVFSIWQYSWWSIIVFVIMISIMIWRTYNPFWSLLDESAT